MVCLKNMVGHEDVDEQLQEEIEDECSKVPHNQFVVIRTVIIHGFV